MNTTDLRFSKEENTCILLCIFSCIDFSNFSRYTSLQVQMFGGGVDDSSNAVGEQLYFLPAQRQGGACR